MLARWPTLPILFGSFSQDNHSKRIFQCPNVDSFNAEVNPGGNAFSANENVRYINRQLAKMFRAQPLVKSEFINQSK